MDSKSSSSSRDGVPVATHDDKQGSSDIQDENGGVTSFTGARRRSSAAGTFNVIENPLTVSDLPHHQAWLPPTPTYCTFQESQLTAYSESLPTKS